ncbi:hypothetical protein LCGC14_2720870, partial [marine sediment metagenome]
MAKIFETLSFLFSVAGGALAYVGLRR